jgi:hypothetical protein
MKTFIVGFIIICTIGIVFNLTMKYRTLYKIYEDDGNGKT